MKHAAALSKTFEVLSVLLFGAMCAYVAYEYRALDCAMRHSLSSAPPWVAFVLAIPFALAIAICLALHFIFRRKARRRAGSHISTEA